MPYQGCPGQDVCLTTQVLISRSQLQQCELCKRLPSKIPQVPSRLTVVIFTFWTQSRTVSRLPVWPWKTGIKPSKWILLYIWSSLDCGMELWRDDSPNWLIYLHLVSSCRNKITSYLNRASCTEVPAPGSQRRPSFSWFCQPHTERLLLRDATMRLVI